MEVVCASDLCSSVEVIFTGVLCMSSVHEFCECFLCRYSMLMFCEGVLYDGAAVCSVTWQSVQQLEGRGRWDRLSARCLTASRLPEVRVESSTLLMVQCPVVYHRVVSSSVYQYTVQ